MIIVMLMLAAGSPDDAPIMGAENGPCYGNATCDAPLKCVEGRCEFRSLPAPDHKPLRDAFASYQRVRFLRDPATKQFGMAMTATGAVLIVGGVFSEAGMLVLDQRVNDDNLRPLIPIAGGALISLIGGGIWYAGATLEHDTSDDLEIALKNLPRAGDKATAALERAEAAHAASVPFSVMGCGAAVGALVQLPFIGAYQETNNAAQFGAAAAAGGVSVVAGLGGLGCAYFGYLKGAEERIAAEDLEVAVKAAEREGR